VERTLAGTESSYGLEVKSHLKIGARACFQTRRSPPSPPCKRGEKSVKVPLFKGDLGGSDRGEMKTRPRGREEIFFFVVSCC
jgi:hypothetical protein